uniref:Uncharacterized protein n=1 Tax=Neogobius melanostomus TaxID=47308 RepID=A0A8C6WG84_9GOBI
MTGLHLVKFTCPVGNIFSFFYCLSSSCRKPFYDTYFHSFGSTVLGVRHSNVVRKQALRHQPEEYIFATLSIYLDVIYLFSFMLAIVGGGRD